MPLFQGCTCPRRVVHALGETIGFYVCLQYIKIAPSLGPSSHSRVPPPAGAPVPGRPHFLLLLTPSRALLGPVGCLPARLYLLSSPLLSGELPPRSFPDPREARDEISVLVMRLLAGLILDPH